MAKRYKNNNNLLTVIVAILVVIFLGVAVLIIGYVSRDDNGKWFSNSDLASWHWADSKPNADNNGGNGGNNGGNNGGGDVTEKTQSNVIISESSNSGVSVYSAVLPRSAYAANGISETADTAIKLTATIKPDYAYNKKVTWAIKWKNASAAWAQGKTVTDYVDIVTLGDLEANVVCKQAFGEPVEITCTIEGTEIKATCTADYLKKVTDINVVSGLSKQADGSYLWVWNNYEFDYNIYGESPAPSLTFDTVCGGVGTKDAVSSDTSNQSVKIEFSTELTTAFSPTKTSETYEGLTLDGKELFYVGNSGGKGFLYQKNIIEWYDYEDISMGEGYSTFLTKCLSAGVDFNVTVTAGNLTKTFNVNVVVAAESVDIPSDIEF
ncbi:MAG: hypothetical protein ACI4MB_05780 [Candidatus Coproplasma sp.]